MKSFSKVFLKRGFDNSELNKCLQTAEVQFFCNIFSKTFVVCVMWYNRGMKLWYDRKSKPLPASFSSEFITVKKQQTKM